MAIARVQTAVVAASATATSVGVALGSNVASGNVIVASAKHRTTATGFTDTLSHSYSKDVDYIGNDADNEVVIGMANLTSSGACTITFTQSGSSRIGISLNEYTFSGGATFDKSSTATANNSSLDSGATATTTAADELLVGIGSTSNSANFTWTNSFTMVGESTTSRHGSGDRIVTATGAYNATATLSGSTLWAAAIATYKEAGGAGRTTKNTRGFPLGVNVGMGWRMAV